ncbi:MAG TPA: HAD family hydrolase [Bacteroidales bacterium]|nr:HAD family hydrolase [Bacteroidales bacterium]
MKKSAAVFLDRDGTIIEDVGHVKRLSDVVFYPYTIESLKKLSRDHLLFIITNQSGIAKGIVTEDEVREVNTYILDYLQSQGITITGLYYCPHKTEDNCHCKKPSPYFVLEASKQHNVDLTNSFIIGDHPSDVECGVNAGINPLYVLTGHGTKHKDELNGDVLIFDDLHRGTEHILSTLKQNQADNVDPYQRKPG